MKKVEISEVNNCGIHDGDFVLINHPPSVHKHSLDALKAYVHLGFTMIINPLICWPFGADFDGDGIHCFYPESLKSQAELSQLLSVHQKMFSSHCREANNNTEC